MKADFLKTRVEEFFTTADYHFKKEMYYLSALDLEQESLLKSK